MTNPFFEKPILNSPYGYPARYWELDKTGQPTQKIIDKRRPAEFITPIPKPKKQKGGQQEALLFEGDDLTGDDRKEAEEHNEAARLWISGLEAVNRKLGVARVFDLSATPFFLGGSGYAEGTLFPWPLSDFSLMDASCQK